MVSFTIRIKIKWLLLLLLYVNSLFAYSEVIERAGDTGAVLLPLSGFLIAFSKDDTKGMSQMLEGAAWTLLATHSTKYFVDAERPNKENLNSFPSGHASASFQAASFLYFNYGLEYGLPAYTVASFVAYSRVHSNWHNPLDVIAGAVLAVGIQYVVSKTNFNLTNYVIMPYFQSSTTGISFVAKF